MNAIKYGIMPKSISFNVIVRKSMRCEMAKAARRLTIILLFSEQIKKEYFKIGKPIYFFISLRRKYAQNLIKPKRYNASECRWLLLSYIRQRLLQSPFLTFSIIAPCLLGVHQIYSTLTEYHITISLCMRVHCSLRVCIALYCLTQRWWFNVRMKFISDTIYYRHKTRVDQYKTICQVS